MGQIGSAGERHLQKLHGTAERAARFYADQVLDHLTPAMIDFVGRQEIAFVATADAAGECDNSLRAGAPGFLHVIDPTTLTYPEYRGNGVMASLGNIAENPHVGIMLVDFVHDLIGLHINGTARIVEDQELRSDVPDLPDDAVPGRAPQRWVIVDIDEAYIHCRKHIPRLKPVPQHRDWGTDDAKRKGGGDYFGAKGTRRHDTMLPVRSAPSRRS
ncbi:pyridoxamine 5'-phosphate oxidase family protein [Rhodococcus opacus]|uniref:pyridoxamine 5'-phosphate oxidase family protein n=1 Tax=Rhodococcus opacus TaxID=37919 RepID=UPI00211E2470|nr:pyridoxamine 5'-phosphate oxidase family protein [Rhodococcus opacus]